MDTFLKIGFIAFLALFGYLTSCKSNQNLTEAQKQAFIQRGTAITQQVTAALMSKLIPEVQQNGPSQAIKYCSIQAIPTTDSISKQEKVTISRVSHRNRNPNNIASAAESELINRYISQINAGSTLSPTLKANGSQTIFYSPIVIAMPTCLKCHGKLGQDLQPDVQETLQKLYLNDKATGFAQGELRGLFKIVFSK